MSTTISGNGEIDTPNSDKGLDIGGMLSVDNFMHLQDQKASGTNGGSSVVGRQVRTLNTVVSNTITGASLSSNEIILPAGTYILKAIATSFASNLGRLIIVNVTDTADIETGINGNNNTGDTQTSPSFIETSPFTLPATKNINLTHYLSLARATNGLGSAVSSGDVEIYADVKIWKVG